MIYILTFVTPHLFFWLVFSYEIVNSSLYSSSKGMIFTAYHNKFMNIIPFEKYFNYKTKQHD